MYMGDGWHLDFKQTHFDMYSPPDFYTRVSGLVLLHHLEQLICIDIYLLLTFVLYSSPSLVSIAQDLMHKIRLA